MENDTPIGLFETNPELFVTNAIRFACDNFPVFGVYIEDKEYLLYQTDPTFEPPIRDIFLMGVDLYIDSMMSVYGMSFYDDDTRTDVVTNVMDSYNMLQMLVAVSSKSLLEQRKLYPKAFEDMTTNFSDIYGVFDTDDVTAECADFLSGVYPDIGEFKHIDQSVKFSFDFVLYLKRIVSIDDSITRLTGVDTSYIQREAIANTLTNTLRPLFVKARQHMLAIVTLHFHNHPNENSDTLIQSISDNLMYSCVAALNWIKPTFVSALVKEDGTYKVDKEKFTSLLNQITLEDLTSSGQLSLSERVLGHVMLSMMFEMLADDETSIRYISAKWFSENRIKTTNTIMDDITTRAINTLGMLENTGNNTKTTKVHVEDIQTHIHVD